MAKDFTVKKWGFGMAPISKNMMARYNSAVASMVHLLSNPDDALVINLDDISELKGMFNRSIKKDQWDWFSVFVRLGEPKFSDCRQIVSSLSELRKAITENNLEYVSTLISRLHNLNLPYYLDTFLKDNKFDNTHFSGWLYILSTKHQPDELKIGMTTRSVERRVKEINTATGILYPLSARAIFRVKDAPLAEKLAFETLDKYRIRPDREFFRLPFYLACQIIEKCLAENDLVA